MSEHYSLFPFRKRGGYDMDCDAEADEFTQVRVADLEALLAASYKRRMRALTAWFVIGLVSVGAYVALALAGRPLWDELPFLLLTLAAVVVCGTAGMRRG